ncbi:hypothetical protein [Proteus mirabilis]|uniref:hypothetical protein n=1 Tax=Proteus mirabilis TaxID=584 RepID=UPI0034D5673C
MHILTQTISEEQITSFLERNLNDQTFVVFSKIQGLKNSDNFKIIVNLLVTNRLDLSEIAEIDLFDDKAAEDLINRLSNLYGLSEDYKVNGVDGFNAYRLLVGENYDTSLAKLMKEFKQFSNDKLSDRLNQEIIISVPLVNVGPEHVYYNVSDFRKSFDEQVLTSLLSEKGITDIREILPNKPTYQGSDEMVSLFNQITEMTSHAFREEFFNNNELYHFLCKLPDTTCPFGMFYSNIHQNLNFRKISDDVDEIFRIKVREINAFGSYWVSEERKNSILEEVYTFPEKMINLNDYISNVRFKFALLESVFDDITDTKVDNNVDTLGDYIADLNNVFKLVLTRFLERIIIL